MQGGGGLGELLWSCGPRHLLAGGGWKPHHGASGERLLFAASVQAAVVPLCMDTEALRDLGQPPGSKTLTLPVSLCPVQWSSQRCFRKPPWSC